MTATTTHDAKREAPPMRPPAAALACTVRLHEPVRFSRDAVERALGALPAVATARLDRLAEDGTKMRVVIDDRLFVVGMIARPMPWLAFARTLAHPGSAALAALIEAHGASLVVTCPEPGEGMGEMVMAACRSNCWPRNWARSARRSATSGRRASGCETELEFERREAPA